MDQPNPFDGGLLGDLLKVLSGQAGGSPWFESAKALALGVAASEQPESNPDPSSASPSSVSPTSPPDTSVTSPVTLCRPAT